MSRVSAREFALCQPSGEFPRRYEFLRGLESVMILFWGLPLSPCANQRALPKAPADASARTG
jgi:hypothetical protein